MKARLMAGLLAVAMAVSFATAQEATSSVAQGKWAALFTFQGLSFLGAGEFNGGVGAKYYLTSSLALRSGIALSLASENIPLPQGSSGTEGSISATGFGISVGGEWHLLPTRVSPYVGASINFNTISTDHKYLVVAPATFQRDLKNNSVGELINDTRYYPSTQLGIGAIFGVEFFITKEISLSGEYQIGYSSVSYPDMEDNNAPGVTVTTKYGSASVIGIKSNSSGALTLAVYF